MKKKSLLILPVLLLALASCNKEEEVEEPEDNTPEVTEPTEPGDQGGDDGDQGGDDGEKEEDIGARITLATESYILNPTEDASGNVTGVEYSNPESGLYIADVVKDENGDITYYLDGTPSEMTEEQAADFWPGYSAVGDKYIVVSIDVKDGEILSWTGSDGTPRYEYASDDIVIRISGTGVSEDKLAGTTTYTISDGTKSVNHIVDFSALFDTRITLGTGHFGSSEYVNDPSLAIASVKTDEDGNVTYVLSGAANKMTSQEATDYWPEVAQENDLFFVITVSLKDGEEVSWTSPAGQKSVKCDECDGAENIILRITGAQSYGCNSATTVVFTIGQAAVTTDTDGESSSVTHTVDFSALLPEVEEQ